jgi:hypothetical protein
VCGCVVLGVFAIDFLSFVPHPSLPKKQKEKRKKKKEGVSNLLRRRKGIIVYEHISHPSNTTFSYRFFIVTWRKIFRGKN